MPTPVNAGTLWALAQRLVEAGIRFDRAWDLMRDADFPPTRTGKLDRSVFEAFYSRASGILAHRRFIADQDLGYVPTSEGIIDSGLNYSGNLAYKVRITGTHLPTGEQMTRTFTGLYDRPVSLKQAIVDQLATIELDPDLYEMDAQHAEVVQVERSMHSWLGAVA